MKAKKKKNPFDPSQPLENMRHEKFCQYYSGECWGVLRSAYEKAGYKTKNNASSGAGRLLRNPKVSARIDYLRKSKLKELQVDQLWLTQQRKEIAENADKVTDRLRALRDLEKGLGLSMSELKKDDLETKGEIKIVFEGKKDETI